LKRFAVAAATVAAVLVAAGAAFAATTINNYKASYTFSGKKGTASKPAKVSFNQTINVTPGTPGDRTGILHKITTKIDGVKVQASNASKYTCTAAKINATSNDTKCPKAALVATGAIKATLGSATSFTAPGQACDPELHVWNGGHKKLIFFFVDTGSHQCLGGQLHTGEVPPWTAKYKQSGKNLDVTIPIPNTVDYPLGTSGDEVGSLSFEHLHWISKKQAGKYDIVSTGCKSAKRKYSFSFNASLPGQPAQTSKTSGSAACH